MSIGDRIKLFIKLSKLNRIAKRHLSKTIEELRMEFEVLTVIRN